MRGDHLIRHSRGIRIRQNHHLFRKRFISTIADSLRTIMRTSAQPVAVITTSLSGRKDDENQYVHGATLSSFTTVSLDPPLVAFSLRIPSRLANALTEGSKQTPSKPHFIINILSQKQEKAAVGFAKPGLAPFPISSIEKGETIKGHGDQLHPFMQIATHPSTAIKPPILVLSDSIGALACSLISRHNLQQHSPNNSTNDSQHSEGSDLFLAKVHSLEKLENQKDLLPLLYWNRLFTTIKN